MVTLPEYEQEFIKETMFKANELGLRVHMSISHPDLLDKSIVFDNTTMTEEAISSFVSGNFVDAGCAATPTFTDLHNFFEGIPVDVNHRAPLYGANGIGSQRFYAVITKNDDTDVDQLKVVLEYLYLSVDERESPHGRTVEINNGCVIDIGELWFSPNSLCGDSVAIHGNINSRSFSYPQDTCMLIVPDDKWEGAFGPYGRLVAELLYQLASTAWRHEMEEFIE